MREYDTNYLGGRSYDFRRDVGSLRTPRDVRDNLISHAKDGGLHFVEGIKDSILNFREGPAAFLDLGSEFAQAGTGLAVGIGAGMGLLQHGLGDFAGAANSDKTLEQVVNGSNGKPSIFKIAKDPIIEAIKDYLRKYRKDEGLADQRLNDELANGVLGQEKDERDSYFKDLHDWIERNTPRLPNNHGNTDGIMDHDRGNRGVTNPTGDDESETHPGPF